MIIYIDMDDVICDFKGTYAIMRELNPSLKFPQSSIKFWTSLKPVEGAIKAVNTLRGLHDVFILSAPSIRNPASYSGKRIWVENHLGRDFIDRLILCNYKGLLKGDYLIDDNIKGKGQENFEGTQIVFGNKLFPTWKEVLKVLT